MTISRKLLIYLLGSISILLLVSSFIVVNNLATESRESVRNDIQNIVIHEGGKITAFFEEKGRMLETFFRNPYFVDWFDKYQDKHTDLSNDKAFDTMIESFNAESSSDTAIKSIFAADHDSGVYFFEKGAHWQDDYDLVTRSWYLEATKANRLFIGKMDIDTLDQTIYSAIYVPLKSKTGQFLGLGGMDITLKTIGDIVSNVHYREQGRAILVSKDANIVYMPEQKVEKPEHLNIPLSNQDNQQGNEGFSDLANRIKRGDYSPARLIWQGVEQELAFYEVKSERPSFSWVLVMMVPKDMVEQRAQQSITTSVIFIAIILSAIALVTLLVTRSIVKPLKMIESAMAEIARGDGDLTKRLKKVSNDEVGHVAEEFNQFVERIHQLILQVSKSSNNLNHTIEGFSLLTDEAANRSSGAKEKTDLAAESVQSVVGIAQEISDNAMLAKESATIANNSALEGQEEVMDSVKAIAQMAEQLEQASTVIEKLRHDSEGIGEVLNVIKSIADQTNLLALNAAIEAARAGEQGRGFAVVADEVRTLASRTQESTNSIQDMIHGLQNSSQEAERAMLTSREEMQSNVKKVTNIRERFNEILDKITSVQQQNEHIAQSTQVQSKAADETYQVIESFRKIASSGAQGAVKMKERCESMRDNSENLNKIVGRFKV